MLAIINEIYYRNTVTQPDLTEGRKRLADKVTVIQQKTALLQHFKFSDFGTRRRFSYAWQTEVVDYLRQQLPKQFTGTSQCLFWRSNTMLSPLVLWHMSTYRLANL